MPDTNNRPADVEVPLEKKLDDLYSLIDGIETAMFTTRRSDGSLVSRAMATQRRTAGADLWFAADWYSEKLDEIALDPHVNVSYFRERTGEWVSVSGRALISGDPDLIKGLYAPEWTAWIAGAGRDTAEVTRRMALILVTADYVTYSKNDRPTPMVLFAVAKAKLTGTATRVADQRDVSADELREGARRNQAQPINS